MTQDLSRRDTIDVREVLGAFRRGIRWLPVGITLGIAGGLLVNLLPHRYESEATVVLRDRSDGGVGGFSLGMMDDLPSGIGESLALPGGSFSGQSETEAAILQSRSLLRQVVDELGLQVRVQRPRATGAHGIFAEIRMEEDAPRGTFTFRRSGQGFDVGGTGGYEGRVEAGGTVELPGGRLTLGAGALPDGFTIQVRSQWETVDQIVRGNDVQVDQAGGDLAEVVAQWSDPWTAAAIANRLVESYLGDRRDRIQEVSGDRFRLLGEVRDSLGTEVDRAAEALRRFHLESGTFDPERLGDLERIAELRAVVDEVDVESRALDEVLRRLNESEEIQTADLLAFPSFLESPAINQILERLSELRDERELLLERRTAQDPDVQVLERAIRTQEQELVTLARSYREGLERSLDEIEGRLGEYRSELAGRPQVETEGILLQSALEVTSATYVAVQTQVVRTRLERVGEGAGLRQVDEAVPAERPRFPRRNLNLALGLLTGLVVGTVGSVAGGAVTGRVTDPAQVRARLGLPVLTPEGDMPLPREIREGTAVLVPARDPGTGEQARALLERQWGLDESTVRVSRASAVRAGDRVLLVLKNGANELGAAEELLPALHAAGATPVAAILVSGRRGT